MSDPTQLLGVILGAALFVRAAFAIGTWLLTKDPTVFYTTDTSSYFVPARELLTRGTFTTRLGQPELLRTPGYPLLLVPGIRLGRLTVTTIAAQIVLSTITVAGVFALANRMFGDTRLALAGAALYAIEPLSIIFSVVLVSETLFTLLVVWALALIVDYVRARQVGPLIGGAALLAASAYVRPVSYFLPLPLFALLGVYGAVVRRWRMLADLALAAAAAFVVLLPWLARNQALGFRGMSAVSAKNLYFFDAAALRAARTGQSFEATRAMMGFDNDSVYLQLHPEQRGWRPGDRFQFMADEGALEVRANLALYARMHVAGMLRVLFDPGAIDLLRLYHRYPPHGGLLNTTLNEGLGTALGRLLRTNALAFSWLLLMGAGLCVVYGLAVRGLAITRGLTDPGIVLVVAVASYFVLVSGGPASLGRFRHPVMPVVCALAGAGLLGRSSGRVGGASNQPTDAQRW